MELYTLLREFADSWALLVMVAFFTATILFAFRPGSAALHRDIAQIPLRDDEPDETCTGCGQCKGDCPSAKMVENF